MSREGSRLAQRPMLEFRLNLIADAVRAGLGGSRGPISLNALAWRLVPDTSYFSSKQPSIR